MCQFFLVFTIFYNLAVIGYRAEITKNHLWIFMVPYTGRIINNGPNSKDEIFGTKYENLAKCVLVKCYRLTHRHK